MFGTLLYFGREIYQAAPPIPTAVRTEGGDSRVHGGSDPPRSKRLAIARRDATGFRLGARQLCRARLVGRLAASRSASAARSAREPRTRRRLCAAARSGSGALAGDAAGGDAHQHLRSAVRRAHDHGRSGSRDRARRRALFRPFPCRLARRAEPARAVRISSQRDTHCRGIVRAERVLLLDRLGRDHGAAGRIDHLHEQLAARAARR